MVSIAETAERPKAELARRHDEPNLARTLKNLIMPRANDDQIGLAIRICNRYGFDPLLRHVLFISGSLYVTRDGLLDNAHRSGQFDGIEVVSTEQVDGAWVATVKVWRKDMSHPFTYTAHQREHENAQSPVWVKAPRAMTVKCAEVMALRRAFNVSLGSAEEIGVDDGVGPAYVDDLPTTYGGVRTGAGAEPDDELDAELNQIAGVPDVPNTASGRRFKQIYVEAMQANVQRLPIMAPDARDADYDDEGRKLYRRLPAPAQDRLKVLWDNERQGAAR